MTTGSSDAEKRLRAAWDELIFKLVFLFGR